MSATTIFFRFLRELEVPHTCSYANKVYGEHPYKYTLYGLSQLLNEYKIENKGLHLENKEDIHLLSTPFLAQVSKDIVIVSSVTDKEVVYDWYGEKITTDYKHFNDLWSGVLLLTYPNEKSSEPEFQKHRNANLINTGKKAVAFLCLFMISVIAFFKNTLYENPLILILLLINGVGLFISYLLLLKQMSIQSNVADRICSLLKHSSCNDILDASIAKFLNFFTWSEVGFSFFLFNIVVLLFVPSDLYYLSVVSICVLPYTLWSVWYQKFRAQHWCPLCLIIQALLWFLFIGYLLGGTFSTPYFSLAEVFSFTALYGVILLLLSLSLPIVVKAKQMYYWKQTFASLKMNNEVFLTLLKTQFSYNVDKDASNILLGNPKASFKITVFSNPYCNPCARMHKRLHRLDGTDCCIQYIFTSFKPEWDNINKYLIAVYQTRGSDETMKILDDWYEGGKKDMENYFTDKHLDIQDEKVVAEFDLHKAWRKETKLNATPTLLVNGYVLPSEYQLEDLYYFIDKKKD